VKYTDIKKQHKQQQEAEQIRLLCQHLRDVGLLHTYIEQQFAAYEKLRATEKTPSADFDQREQ